MESIKYWVCGECLIKGDIIFINFSKINQKFSHLYVSLSLLYYVLNKEFRTEDVAQVVDCLPSIDEALGLTLSTT